MTMETSTTMGWVEVANLDDLWEGELVSAEVDGEKLIVVNVEGRVFAYADVCPHLGTQLSSASCFVDGDTIMCPSHQWMFDAVGGAGINPEMACLRRYSTRVDGDVVYVSVQDVEQELRGM